MIKKISVLCAGLLLATACQTGSSYRPVVSNPGANYETDLAQCQEFSKQRTYFNGDTGVAAAGAGALGAGAGLLMGRGLEGAAAGAAFGAAFGAGSGAMHAKEQKKYIINRCLRERGYNVYL